MGLNSEIREAVNRELPIVSANDSVRDVARKMVDANSTAVIVKVADKVAGVVTEMDMLLSFDRKDDLDATEISRVMTPCELITPEGSNTPCVQLDLSQSVENALGVMHKAGIHHLVITAGDNDEFYGVASILDVLKLALA
jgi:CBS domain-containing protein